jgi:hypothetical protein
MNLSDGNPALRATTLARGNACIGITRPRPDPDAGAGGEHIMLLNAPSYACRYALWADDRFRSPGFWPGLLVPLSRPKCGRNNR